MALAAPGARDRAVRFPAGERSRSSRLGARCAARCRSGARRRALTTAVRERAMGRRLDPRCSRDVWRPGGRRRFVAGVTRQIVSSSATSSAPCLSSRTPTGRPCASPFVVEEAGQHVLRRARGLAVRERHEDHLVAGARLAIPRAVLADEGAAGHLGRKQIAGVEGEPERGRVRAERVIRARSPSARDRAAAARRACRRAAP